MNIEEEEKKHFAVLIDADNISEKYAASIFNEKQIRDYYNIAECYNFEFKLWQNYGKTRAYYTTNGMSKYWNNKGNFVDLTNI